MERWEIFRLTKPEEINLLTWAADNDENTEEEPV